MLRKKGRAQNGKRICFYFIISKRVSCTFDSFFFTSSTSIQSFPPKQVLHNYLTWCCKIYRHLQNPVRLIPHGRSHPPEQGMCLGMHLAYAGIRSIHMLHERMNNLMNPLSEHHSQREIQPKEFWLRLHVHCIHGRSHMLRFVDTFSRLLNTTSLHLRFYACFSQPWTFPPIRTSTWPSYPHTASKNTIKILGHA